MLKKPLYEFSQSDVRRIEFLDRENSVVWPSPPASSTDLVEYLKPADSQYNTFVVKL